MSYLPHQVEASDKLLAVLRKKGVALLAGEMRTGKTRSAIRVAETGKAQRILVVTKKAAIAGWHSELKAVKALKMYTVTNYEQVAKLEANYDLCIVDESHAVGRAGKPTQRFVALRKLTYEVPLILLSGTPAVETHLAYYYQFGLSKWSPFAKFKNFYDFFRVWGEPSMMRLHGRWVEQYKKAKPEIMEQIRPHIVSLTQEQAGIQFKAIDKVHKVALSADTRALISEIQDNKVATINGELVGFDSDIKERVTVHQIETGAVLIDEEIVELPNTEVVDYIKETFGDSEGLALMAHFRSTREKLRQHFPKATIYSSVAHAEGVDLSGCDHLVIVNTCYSGAKHIQRRDRVVNLNRKTEAVVHHIVCDGGISPVVYNAVSRKHDFNLKMYRELRNEGTRRTAKNN